MHVFNKSSSLPLPFFLLFPTFIEITWNKGQNSANLGSLLLHSTVPCSKYWELFFSFSQTSCAQIQQIFPDAKSGYYWVYIKGKKAQVYCDMDNYGMNALYLSCISLVFVAGFSYWSIQLHPLNLLATWFRQQWMMKTPKFNLFWGRGDE